MTESSASQTTRERILVAACTFFAEKGYRGAGITEICKAAGANIASISYYFGGKKALYQQAWQYAHQDSLKRCPPDGGVAGHLPVEVRLKGRIRAGLQRALTGGGVEFQIMRNEMTNPTGLLHQIVDDAIRPIREETQAILRELLGPGANDRDVELCEVCVVGPWMHLHHHEQQQKHEGLPPAFHEEMLDDMVEHFVTFALAGIRETRRRIEQSGTRRVIKGKKKKIM